jgi:hypothetical protein
MVFGIAVAGAILYNLAHIAASANPGAFTPSDIQDFLNGLQWAYIAGAGFAGLSALTSLLAVERQTENAEEVQVS